MTPTNPIPLDAYEQDIYRNAEWDGKPVDWNERPARDHKPTNRSMGLLNYGEMSAMTEPEWLIEDIIQKNSAALLFGKSNSFKSFLAIDMALSVDSGLEWHGKAVSRGRVLFVVTEGANGVGRLRIPAWYDHHSVPHDERRAFLYPQEICLDATEEVGALIGAMKEYGGFDLLVLDIFGGTMKGSEIEDKTARAWVHGVQRIIRETGATVLVVAHAPYQDDTRIRGHSHFWGSFDTRLRIEGDKDNLTATLTVERHKDADSTGQWGFRMEKAAGSLVPEMDGQVRTGKGKKGLSGRERQAANALDEATIAYGERRFGSDWPPVPVVLVKKWREQFYRLSGEDTEEANKKAFDRARKTLLDRGIIAFFDAHVWRCS